MIEARSREFISRCPVRAHDRRYLLRRFCRREVAARVNEQGPGLDSLARRHLLRNVHQVLRSRAPPPISHPCCLSDTLLLCVPRSPKVVVVGSTNVDLIAYCPKLPRPGETLMGTNFVQCFGGKVCPLPTPDAHPH